MSSVRSFRPAVPGWCLALSILLNASHALAAEPEEPAKVAMTANQLLDLADKLATTGDRAAAERTYRALFDDPSVEVRSEARFRLAMLFVQSQRLSDAAILLREILDEQPRAQRVRLELARVLDLMGDDAGARRALREAQAGGLPPDVARFVDRYSAALRAQKPLGGSIEVAFAPDSNINRATRSDTLGTVLGDFELDEDARERSGLGAALRGQGYARWPVSKSTNLFGRISGSADIYRSTKFNDLALAVTAGPEFRSGADRFSIEVGSLWRWYGGRAYSQSTLLGANYFHPMGRTAQLRMTASLAFIDNRLNSSQDGQTYAGSIGYERAVSARAGFGITVSAERQALRDPGYSTWSGQISFTGYREVGAVTLFASATYGKLEADQRLFLFPEPRSDQTYRASLGATFRKLRIGAFAPFIRATFERNHSNSEIYDYRKVRAELGVSRAF